MKQSKERKTSKSGSRPGQKLHPNKQLRAMVGDRFGKLTIVKRVATKKGRYGFTWMIKCDCGSPEVKVLEQYLFRAQNPKRDCGCSKQSLMSIYKREAGIWAMMTRRCVDPSHVGYKYYGGRGIKVHPEWLHRGYAVSFEENLKAFTSWFKHIGPAPSLEHTMDRKDPDGDYVPGNIRWATHEEQANNKSKTCGFKAMRGRPPARVQEPKSGTG